MITIQGKGVSTGVAVGPLYFYKRTDQTIRRYETEDQEAKSAENEESAKTAASKQAKEASKHQGAKVSAKQAAPSKTNVPRKVV